ncbi:MAG: sigma-54-dependent Fis family transcriptional regulator [Sandaracinaceae bacterium]|nr:sigma-54-dependent Fis family transcriptional regulator [Sandaracinaceae bacterium]
MLREVLAERGHEVLAAGAAKEALAHLAEASVVVSDLAMPGMDGMALLEASQRLRPDLPFILLTAHGNERVAVGAMRAGAHDYLTKPVDIDELVLVVERALEQARTRAELRRIKAERTLGRRLVAASAAMRRLLAAVERVADKDVTVLVRGETGTGKELIASLVHAHSRREDRPLVRFNCAAVVAELAEAELFGHARGAFTGAVSSHRGFFASADGGTLVLDEIGELPLSLQPKLLRAMQEGEIQPIGGRIERVDVRIVACTHRDLGEEVRAGRFRQDLYYRLAVVELVVPPLRERREEIGALATELAQRQGERFGMAGVTLSQELLDALAHADWPGNVRELENTIARMLALHGPRLGLPAWSPSAPATVEAEGEIVRSEPGRPLLPLREQVDAFERGVIERVLAECGGNQSEAARRLAIGRATLIDKMKRHGIR